MEAITGSNKTFIWLMAIRPRTLALSVSPVLLGSALALADRAGAVNGFLPLLIIIAALAIQAATNLFNDCADYLNGTDDARRTGPERITSSGLATPSEVMRAGYLMLLLAALIGLYLVWLGGLPILLLGLCSLLAGYAYSHGPWPISRSPLGELFVVLFFGLGAVAGSFYLQTGRFTPDLLLWGLVMGLPAAAVLLVNNTRDREGDRRAGRRTLAILLDLPRIRLLYGLMMLTPFLLLPLLVLPGGYPLSALLGLLALPWFIAAVRLFRRMTPGPEMNLQLGRTVQTQLILTLASSAGLLISLAI